MPVALGALMWIGRSDYEPDGWKTAYRDAIEQKTTSTGHYLITTRLAPDYLEEGLAYFKIACSDLGE